jgi:phosphate transport system permease protein
MTAVTQADFNPRQIARRNTTGRQRLDRLFVYLCVGTAFFSVVILAVLLLTLLIKGLPHLSLAFVNNPPSSDPAKAGIRPALFGTAWACLGCALFALPLGVATAVFLEEYKPRRRLLRWFHGFVQLNIANLAGVPSVVYGIIGVTAFVTMFGVLGSPSQPSLEFGVRYYDRFYPDPDSDAALNARVSGRRALQAEVAEGLVAYDARWRPVTVNVLAAGEKLPHDPAELARTLRVGAKPDERVSRPNWYYVRLPFGQSVLAGSLTLMLVVLPIVIIASQEALRAVPNSLREGALGLGATRWQVVRNVTLPSATPGIMTGAILSMSRAVGEAAPVLIIAGAAYNRFVPANLMDQFSVMPVVIYGWAARPGQGFEQVAATGIIVLLGVLLVFNLGAVIIRYRFQKSAV